MENQVTVLSKTEINIDMEKVAIVGIAKGERKFKEELKSKKKELSNLEKESEGLYTRMNKEAENAVPEDVRNAKSIFENKFKELGIDITSKLSINVNEREKTNSFSLSFLKEKGNYYSDKTMEVLKSVSDFSERQKTLLNDIKEKDKQINIVSDRIVELRRKLTDMNSLERQVKASIIENELNKSAEGKALLSKIEEGFDENIKLLGV